MSRASREQGATTPEVRRPGSPALALILATLAFLVCFAVWGLIAPFALIFRDMYGLSGARVRLLVAVPVLLGSLARIPLGILADRYGGRLVFTILMLVLLAPVALAGLTRSYVSLLAVRFLLGVAGASFAGRGPVRLPVVSAGAPGLRARRVRDRHRRVGHSQLSGGAPRQSYRLASGVLGLPARAQRDGYPLLAPGTRCSHGGHKEPEYH